MKNTILQILTITTLLIAACTSSQQIAKSTQEVSSPKQVTGHLKMELIEYEILDTLNTSKEVAEMMVSMVKPSMETELVFNSIRSAELVKKEDGYQRKSLYDRSTKTAFLFLRKDSINYYSEMNLTEMMAKMETTEEEAKEFDKMFTMNPYAVSKMQILGFNCDEVIMRQPPDYATVYTQAYMTEEIPHLSEAMGPMSKYFSGASIKTILFVNGLKITTGATKYLKNPAMDKYLEFDASKFQKLSMEEMEAMKN